MHFNLAYENSYENQKLCFWIFINIEYNCIKGICCYYNKYEY